MPGTILSPGNTSNEQQQEHKDKTHSLTELSSLVWGEGKKKKKVKYVVFQVVRSALSKIKQRKECWTGVGTGDLNRVVRE